jgi:hypothetical protein
MYDISLFFIGYIIIKTRDFLKIIKSLSKEVKRIKIQLKMLKFTHPIILIN